MVNETVNETATDPLGSSSSTTDIGEPYGLCMYRSPHDGRVYVIINGKLGAVAQYEAALDPIPALTLRRTLQFDGGLEGCVADDELARLYIGQEELGVWRLDGETEGDDEPILLHDVDDPYLTADIEGMTIYYATSGRGYLLVSSQGSNTYAVFERGGDNAYLTSFRVGLARSTPRSRPTASRSPTSRSDRCGQTGCSSLRMITTRASRATSSWSVGATWSRRRTSSC